MAKRIPKQPRRRGTGSLTWDTEKGCWRARTVPVHGHRVTRLFRPDDKTAPKVRQAETRAHEWLDRQVEAIRRGELSDATLARGDQKLSDWIDEWLTEFQLSVKNEQKSRRSFESFQGDAHRYVVPFLGGVKLKHLTGSVINRWLLDLYDVPSRKGGTLSHSTVLRAYRTLHAALEAAKLGHNAADEVKLAKVVDQAERITWEPGEVTKFLDHVEECPAAGGKRLAAMWRVFAKTGARRSEVLALRWDDIQLQSSEEYPYGCMEIRQTINTVGHGVYRSRTTKTRRQRTVAFIEPETPRMLAEWREEQVRQPWSEFGDLVFTNEKGEPLHPVTISRYFAAHVAHLDIRRSTLHGLRHAHASHLIAAHLPLSMIARRLGHSTRTLEDIYAHEIAALRRESVDAMAEAHRRLFA